jgi:hypothetical protein
MAFAQPFARAFEFPNSSDSVPNASTGQHRSDASTNTSDDQLNSLSRFGEHNNQLTN